MSDKSNPPVCEDCGYDLSDVIGEPEWCCPECGGRVVLQRYVNERQFVVLMLRTIGWPVGAFLCVAGVYLSMRVFESATGWASTFDPIRPVLRSIYNWSMPFVTPIWLLIMGFVLAHRHPRYRHRSGVGARKAALAITSAVAVWLVLLFSVGFAVAMVDFAG